MRLLHTNVLLFQPFQHPSRRTNYAIPSIAATPLRHTPIPYQPIYFVPNTLKGSAWTNWAAVFPEYGVPSAMLSFLGGAPLLRSRSLSLTVGKEKG